MTTVRGLEHRCSLGGRLVHPRHCIFAVDRAWQNAALNFMRLALFAVPLAAAYREFTKTHVPNLSLTR
jgi:hypothetical protein